MRTAPLLVVAAIVWAAPSTVTLSVQARAIQPGELVVLTIATSEIAGAVHVRAFDRDWPSFAADGQTWRTIIGIDLDVAPGDYPVGIRADSASGVERLTHTLTVEGKTFRTRKLTVDPAYVNPPASVQARIARENAELNEIWGMSSATPLWTGAFVRPVPHQANSAFGLRSIFNGEPRSAHPGADFLSPSGTPVKSPGGGVVRLAADRYYTGGTVVVDHGLGLVSLFAHLSRVDVEKGATVAAGDVLGRVGATGRVTGAHLHWTLRANGARVDPLSLLAVLGGEH